MSDRVIAWIRTTQSFFSLNFLLPRSESVLSSSAFWGEFTTGDSPVRGVKKKKKRTTPRRVPSATVAWVIRPSEVDSIYGLRTPFRSDPGC